MAPYAPACVIILSGTRKVPTPKTLTKGARVGTHARVLINLRRMITGCSCLRIGFGRAGSGDYGHQQACARDSRCMRFHNFVAERPRVV
eukprot:50036-Pyramimonas_sp.AAC.1